MKSLLLIATVLSTCTPGPAPSPAPVPTVTVPLPPDASLPAADCASARYAMVQLGCPPDEDAYGGWVLECSGWPDSAVIASCIAKQTSCVGTRECLGK